MRLIPVDPGLAWRLILPSCDIQTLCKLMQTEYALYSYILRNQLMIAAVEQDQRHCKDCGCKLGSCGCRNEISSCKCPKGRLFCRCRNPNYDRTVVDCLVSKAIFLNPDHNENYELRTRGFINDIE